MNKHFGKYRGKVENNIDPTLSGRIQVSVPSVLGKGRLSWAMPSAPYGGSGVGFIAIPPNKANVWVEFEGGNTDHPIWSGCFWGVGEFPSQAALPEVKLFKTATATLTLNDLPGVGGVTIETKDGKKITMNAMSIKITDGKWSIEISPTSVAINTDGLVVT
jgi:uncharacterized protein involved in type VI secretion and phage assembly